MIKLIIVIVVVIPVAVYTYFSARRKLKKGLETRERLIKDGKVVEVPLIECEIKTGQVTADE